jgi:hypothetical protein
MTKTLASTTGVEDREYRIYDLTDRAENTGKKHGPQKTRSSAYFLTTWIVFPTSIDKLIAASEYRDGYLENIRNYVIIINLLPMSTPPI